MSFYTIHGRFRIFRDFIRANEDKIMSESFDSVKNRARERERKCEKYVLE